MNQKEILYRAAQIKLQVSQLEAEYDMLKPDILQAITDLSNPDKQAVDVGELGRFILAPVRGWKYTTRTEEFAASLKELQRTEQANGMATKTEIFVPKFIAKKNE